MSKNFLTEEEVNNIFYNHKINLKKSKINKWIKENQEELEFSFYNLLELLTEYGIKHRKIKLYSWAKYCYKNRFKENYKYTIDPENLDELKFNYKYTSENEN